MEGEEEQKWEQEEVEEEEEKSTLQVRKSRTEIEVGINGSSENNGHEILPKNGAENGKSTVKDEQILEEFDAILEEEIVKEKSDNSVYYDKDEGIWKCRICYWTYQSGSFCADSIQNHNGHLHKLMNDKISTNSVVITEGVEFTSTYSGQQQIKKTPQHDVLDISSQKIVAQNNSTSTVNSQREGDLEDNILSISSLPSSEFSYEDYNKKSEPSKEIESAEIDLTTGDELRVTELDVEGIIQKQATHDLYCPNCNSCITGRVILRKRKRYIQVSDEEAKRNGLESEANFKVVTGIVQETLDQVCPTANIDVDVAPTPNADDNDRGREPEIFRCLSCFSFFIPTRNGFKLFGRFGEKSLKENIQDVQVPIVKKNWFATVFASNRPETSVEQGSRLGQDMGKGDVGLMDDQLSESSSAQKASTPACVSEEHVDTTENNKSMEGNAKIVSSPRQGPVTGVIGAGDNFAMPQKKGIDSMVNHLEVLTSDQLKQSKLSKEVQANNERDLSVTRTPDVTQSTNGESVENGTLFSPNDGLKLLISSTEESVTIEKSENDQMPNLITETGSAESGTDSKMDVSVDNPHEFEKHVGAAFLTGSVVETRNANFTSSENDRAYPTEVSGHIITTTKLEVHMGESHKVNSISLVKDSPVILCRPADIAKDIKQVAAEKDGGLHAVLTIDAPPVEATASQSTQDIIISAETGSALHSGTQIFVVDRETETRKAYTIEVIKSIVYGGLAESITSLSIVSSAAGGDTATLNVIALGLANLIGGLFIIIHNLWDLKSNRVEQVSNQINEQGDRYRELLGRRENFVLHAAVAVLSYFIFGLVPPLTYGFSFLKSDDKEFKLLAVAAASLICIVILAIGKAYCQRPQKSYIKTVVPYVILGLMVSGVSYAAGMLIKRLLEKLRLFESSSVAETTPTPLSWASY
ncbi:membrane protein of ER body 2-like isoform X2 [Olea europaea var. sylvestris]|uniref:membrane protein of ER body 2-like isoform X2 n=1 Tax=Olea europaea var. sylvestris TaxID=158386 RepID=UPI000C1D225C|nr:membrane protein of ER body 2-like isoform X2 [Olea europaea var. sylvestris]